MNLNKQTTILGMILICIAAVSSNAYAGVSSANPFADRTAMTGVQQTTIQQNGIQRNRKVELVNLNDNDSCRSRIDSEHHVSSTENAAVLTGLMLAAKETGLNITIVETIDHSSCFVQ